MSAANFGKLPGSESLPNLVLQPHKFEICSIYIFGSEFAPISDNDDDNDDDDDDDDKSAVLSVKQKRRGLHPNWSLSNILA